MAKKAQFYDESSQQNVLIDVWQGTPFTITRDGNGDITSYREEWDDNIEQVFEIATPTYDSDGVVTEVKFDDGRDAKTLTINRDSDGRITGGVVT